MIPKEKDGTVLSLTGKKSVKLVLHAPEANTVEVAGSFGGWRRKAMKVQADGNWKTSLRLTTGVYEYKFIIDGQWCADPQNDVSRPDGHGSVNSLLTVD